MGCVPTKEEFLHHFSLEEVPESQGPPNEPIIELLKGGMLIKTSIGYIQYGIPPETVKDSLSIGVPVPEYYIVPKEKFDWSDGISLMEFEFPVYYNFFLRKQNKTKLICDAETMEQIRIIFQETLLGPKSFENFESDFVKGYEAKPDLAKELAFFAKNPFLPGSDYHFEQFIEFHLFDSKHQATITKEVDGIQYEIKIAKRNETFTITENGRKIATFDDEMKVRKTNFFVYQNVKNDAKVLFTPPLFGFTVLGNSHGFDMKGSTSGFIIWINRRGVMIDPPPFSARALRDQGIPPNLIEKIIITHCHADHDAGAFHKIIEASPVEFLSTNTILNSFLRKYSAISGLSVKEISKLFQYRTIEIGHPTFILGARFTFGYSFHSIPALRFEVEFRDKRFYFSGDTFYNPKRLEELFHQGLFSRERFESLALVDFSRYDVIFHEAGIPPIHTPTSAFLGFEPKILERLYLIHIAEKDLPPGSGLKGIPVGLENTLVLISDASEENDPILSNLQLLCSVEMINWVPFNRILEIIKCFREKSFSEDDMIIMEKTFGDCFYVVKKGVVKVFSNDKTNSFSKLCYSGDYFGESAIISNGYRLANVQAVTDCTLLEINQSDFKWVFNYQSRVVSNTLSPLELIKNLSDIRRAKEGEFINLNATINRMTENQKCMINMYIREINVTKNEYLWRPGEIPEFCFLVKSGNFQIKAPFKAIPNNVSLQPGSLIGDFPSLLKQSTCKSSVKCLTDGTIFRFDSKYLNQFLNQYPGFFIAIKDKYVIQ